MSKKFKKMLNLQQPGLSPRGGEITGVTENEKPIGTPPAGRGLGERAPSDTTIEHSKSISGLGKNEVPEIKTSAADLALAPQPAETIIPQVLIPAKTTAPPRERTTFNLDVELLRKLRLYHRLIDTPITHILERIIRDFLSDKVLPDEKTMASMIKTAQPKGDGTN